MLEPSMEPRQRSENPVGGREAGEDNITSSSGKLKKLHTIIYI